MTSCPRLCPLCASREFYLLAVGRWICKTCAPPVGPVVVTLAWIDDD